MGCSLEKKIENLIQCLIDEHEVVNENWFSIVEVGAMKREVKVAVQDVADKIHEIFVNAGLTSIPQCDDDYLKTVHDEVLGLLVEEGEK